MLATDSSVSAPLAARVAAHPWYHTIELPGGVVTEGLFDLRAVPERCGMPERLDGLRCLDVGTANGFWAFEMERRGAAEVVALDVDDPQQRDWPDNVPPERRAMADDVLKRGFWLAHEALGSQVERLDLRVYDLDPEIHGQFDLIFIGSLLLHLQDPVAALQVLRRVCRGQLISADSISLSLTFGRPRTPAAKLYGESYSRWYTPNVAAHRRWLDAAGWNIEDSGGLYWIPTGKAMRFKLPPLRRRGTLVGLGHVLMLTALGMPSTWARCRPRTAPASG